MMRRKILHAAALFFLIVITVPGFALLCRGHSPSRFATSNLPFWERSLPHPAKMCATLQCPPLPPGAVQFTDAHLRNGLLNADLNTLFFPLEHPSKRHPDPLGGGRPGQWLITACALGRHEAALRQAQDAVAMRLMNDQDTDGYLAAGTGPKRWSQSQILACAQNLRGLLSYYALTRSPAAVYAAMRTGDLVLTEFPDAASGSPGASGLTLPLTLLYQTTGEMHYRQWAVGQADAGKTDGPGLCALYVATGEARYLRLAQQIWKRDAARHHAVPDLTASLWALTGDARCATTLRTDAAPWVCPTVPGTVTTCARIPGGLAIGPYANVRVSFGTVHLTERITADPHGEKKPAAVFTVQTSHPCAFTLKLAAPVSATSPARLNNSALPSAACGQKTLTLTRRWKSGDTVVIPLPSPSASTSTSRHSVTPHIAVR